MPRMLKRPTYLLHKATGQARVRIGGRDIYLGAHGSAESRARYDELLDGWHRRTGDGTSLTLTVDDLVLYYMEHAQAYYRKDGAPTSEINCIKQATRPLIKLYGNALARDFGPRALKAVRQAMIDAQIVRRQINIHIGRIRRAFKWAVGEEMLPPAILIGLQAVKGLEEGRSEAVESTPVRPVSKAAVNAVRPYVSRQVWGMIELQLATGMRPGEVTIIRGCDLVMAGSVWEYVPHRHKTSHRRKKRLVCLGPKAQSVIRPFLKADLSAYLFSPVDARREFVAANYREGSGVGAKGRRYSVASYESAIRRGCERAFGMPLHLRRIDKKLSATEQEDLRRQAAEWRRNNCWHPHRLRHTAATAIRREYGIEITRAVLGHSSVTTSEIYAEMDSGKAREVAIRMG